ncbi:hypothetical protein CANCADRAFT_134666 [Tortispora caseinolytica NRRL Y-17796]|uniref:Protein Zds1 C-terminal domain-containing protein n=1 Tax=Tortispora caseinolytica NRRL Y-17796 TaxID=767744 RepID=A0A1E4TBS3_9ASCO|nr:hypothetical protein CANCADRAFT_134666 [Tortispora caseinolytica NRRL Y-17796]
MSESTTTSSNPPNEELNSDLRMEYGSANDYHKSSARLPRRSSSLNDSIYSDIRAYPLSDRDHEDNVSSDDLSDHHDPEYILPHQTIPESSSYPLSAYVPLGNMDTQLTNEVVAAELSSIKALRRISLDTAEHGVGNDPDLPFSISSTHQLPQASSSPVSNGSPDRLHKRTSSQSTVASDSSLQNYNDIWVPAHLHPELAPLEWKTFIEQKVSELEKYRPNNPDSFAASSSSNSNGTNQNESKSKIDQEKLRRRKSRLSQQIDVKSGANDYRDASESLRKRRSANAPPLPKVADLDVLDHISDEFLSIENLPQPSARPKENDELLQDTPMSSPLLAPSSPSLSDTDQFSLQSSASSGGTGLRRSYRTVIGHNSLRRGYGAKPLNLGSLKGTKVGSQLSVTTSEPEIPLSSRSIDSSTQIDKDKDLPPVPPPKSPKEPATSPLKSPALSISASSPNAESSFERVDKQVRELVNGIEELQFENDIYSKGNASTFLSEDAARQHEIHHDQHNAVIVSPNRDKDLPQPPDKPVTVIGGDKDLKRSGSLTKTIVLDESVVSEDAGVFNLHSEKDQEQPALKKSKPYIVSSMIRDDHTKDESSFKPTINRSPSTEGTQVQDKGLDMEPKQLSLFKSSESKAAKTSDVILTPASPILREEHNAQANVNNSRKLSWSGWFSNSKDPKRKDKTKDKEKDKERHNESKPGLQVDTSSGAAALQPSPILSSDSEFSSDNDLQPKDSSSSTESKDSRTEKLLSSVFKNKKRSSKKANQDSSRKEKNNNFENSDFDSSDMETVIDDRNDAETYMSGLAMITQMETANQGNDPNEAQLTIENSFTRFPIHIERAIYRLSHIKLANPRRCLAQQVVLTNFMYGYLNLINQTPVRQLQPQSPRSREEMKIPQEKTLERMTAPERGLVGRNRPSNILTREEMETLDEAVMDQELYSNRELEISENMRNMFGNTIESNFEVPDYLTIEESVQSDVATEGSSPSLGAIDLPKIDTQKFWNGADETMSEDMDGLAKKDVSIHIAGSRQQQTEKGDAHSTDLKRGTSQSVDRETSTYSPDNFPNRSSSSGYAEKAQDHPQYSDMYAQQGQIPPRRGSYDQGMNGSINSQQQRVRHKGYEERKLGSQIAPYRASHPPMSYGRPPQQGTYGPSPSARDARRVPLPQDRPGHMNHNVKSAGPLPRRYPPEEPRRLPNGHHKPGGYETNRGYDLNSDRYYQRPPSRNRHYANPQGAPQGPSKRYNIPPQGYRRRPPPPNSMANPQMTGVPIYEAPDNYGPRPAHGKHRQNLDPRMMNPANSLQNLRRDIQYADDRYSGSSAYHRAT